LWAAIAGLLRAVAGANEVITTIMLNWIAVWIGVWLFSLGRPLQNGRDRLLPVSADVVRSARLRSRVAGAARRPVRRLGRGAGLLGADLPLDEGLRGAGRRVQSQRRALSGDRRRSHLRLGDGDQRAVGVAGAIDVLGWEFRLATNDSQASSIGFLGIAVALLGRNTALGTCLAALLFGGLVSGTSVRHLDPAVFKPALGGNLTCVIQGVVVLLVSADVLVV
jgi:general nucleoside transport system permease protein